MAITPEIFTVKDLVAQVEAGERMFIHASQFAAFLVETEYLRLNYCIKTSVVGEQVILERWDIGGDKWDDGARGKNGTEHNWLH